MVNEFLKSIVRTLGRIFAYALIGFIIFYLFSVFKVNAQTIIADEYYIQSFNRNGVIQEDNVGTQIDDWNNAVGFNVKPIKNGQDISISASEYYINIGFTVAMNTPVYYRVIPSMNIYVGNTQAVCDGREFLQPTAHKYQYDKMFIRYDYTCTLLEVTNSFPNIRVQIVQPNQLDNLGIYPRQFFMDLLEFLDQNDLNTDTQAITGRIDDQTQIIVNNNNNNTQTIIENNNSNTTRITDKQDVTNQKLDNINNSINNSSVDNPNSSFNGFKNNIASTDGIQTIFLLPLTLFQAIINNQGGSCSSISLGSLYGTNLTLPCINIESYLGSTIYTMIDLLCALALILGLRKYVLEIFNKITSLKEDNLQ